MNAATDFDAVIIGGGPGGAAAGIELARAGRKVAIVERSVTMHDKVCGDFLSGEAVEYLGQLGVDTESLGAVAIEHVRLVGLLCRSRSKLPFVASSVSRRVLDEALLRSAARCGVLVLRGHAAEALHPADAGWCVEIASGDAKETLHVQDVVLATGKHDLRGLSRPAGEHSGLVGLKMYLRLGCAQRESLEGVVEVVLFDNLRGGAGYCGLSMVEDEVANLCFVVDRTAVRPLASGWDAMAAMLREHPHLRERLAGAEPLLARPLAISPIPYGFVRREAIVSGVWSVGDQAAVIPSFTGDGIALALHSGRLAARMMLKSACAEAFQCEFYEQVRRQVARSTVLSRALTQAPQRALLEITARVWPGALGLVAAGTRLRPRYRISQCEKICAAT